MIIKNILECIGNTPLIHLNALINNSNSATVYGKAEFLNPMGSVKERPALAIIEDAEKRTELRPGMTVVEATSGNMGLGLAMVCAVKGYQIILIIEKDIADGICRIARTLGAKIIVTDTFINAVNFAKQLHYEAPDKYFITRQFENIANSDTHYKTTANEIIRDIGPKIKAFVTSYGSGGTFTGVGLALKKYNPDIQLILVEPDTMQRFSNGTVTCSQIHGIAPMFIPQILNQNLIDDTISVSEQQAYETVNLMAKKLGILCGPSSGAMVHSAIRIANRFKPDDVVVTILPDRGERYFGIDFFP